MHPVDNLAPTISEEDKRTYGGYFEKLDTQRKGYLTGEQCSPFFLKSNLPAIDLGKIWDLVDTAKSGRISKDGFATAMSLIKKRMAGAELPTSLSATPRPSNILDLPAMSSTAQADPFDPLGRASVAPTSLTAPPLTMSPIVPHSTGDKFSGSFGLGSATTTAPMFTIPQISRPSTLSQYQEAAEREADVNSRREEVKRLTEQLQLLHPTAEELKKKRDELDADFKAVTDEKNKLTIEILQARATYDAEVQIVRDSQALLMSESQRLESSKYELKQIQEAITALREEHSSLTEQIQAYQKDIAESKRLIQISTEETNELRGELEKLRTDARQQQQLVEVNQRLLSSAQLEHQQFKMDLQQERERLEYARQKAAQLQQQASVQSAINQRELGSVKALEKERQREISRSNDILASMAATPAVDYASGRAASLGNIAADVVLPSTPPPPLPPVSSKPLKASIETVAAPPTSILAGVPATTSPSLPSAVLPASQTSGRMSRDELTANEANAEFQRAFDKNLDAAREVGSIHSTKTSAAEPSFAKVTPGDFSDAFTFDATFAAAKPVKSTAGPASGFDFPSDGSTSAVAARAPPSSNAFGSVDFDSVFGGPSAQSKPPAYSLTSEADAFGAPAAFGSSSNAKPSAPIAGLTDVDFDAAFGGSASGAATAPSKDPFGSIDFNSAFGGASGSAAGATAATAPARPDSPVADIPEVRQIVELGFTKEQALNALEM
eukprot:jgi/Hompol1/539/HPOL_001625-RA